MAHKTRISELIRAQKSHEGISNWIELPLSDAKKSFVEISQAMCPGYVIDDSNKDAINDLMSYFRCSPKRDGLNKGLLIIGNVGTGKTLLMDIMRMCDFPQRRFTMRSCANVVREFNMDGHRVIDKYTKEGVRTKNQTTTCTTFCFDDLGAERMGKYYSEMIEVFVDIITERYELFMRHGMITHITTNLSPDDIEQRYGERVLSRMRQMMNFIPLGTTADAKDRRV